MTDIRASETAIIAIGPGTPNIKASLNAVIAITKDAPLVAQAVRLSLMAFISVGREEAPVNSLYPLPMGNEIVCGEPFYIQH